MDKILPVVFICLFAGAACGQQIREDGLSAEAFFQLHDGALYKYTPRGKEKITGKEYINNGMTVFEDGSFTKLNERKRKLKDGQYLDLNGRVFNTIAELQAQQEAHRAAVNRQYYQLRNGEVLEHHGEKAEKIKSEVMLQNGITLYPDGMFSTPEGKKYRLREGQCMDIKGRVFKDTQTFHLDHEKRIKEGIN